MKTCKRVSFKNALLYFQKNSFRNPVRACNQLRLGGDCFSHLSRAVKEKKKLLAKTLKSKNAMSPTNQPIDRPTDTDLKHCVKASWISFFMLSVSGSHNSFHVDKTLSRERHSFFSRKQILSAAERKTNFGWILYWISFYRKMNHSMSYVMLYIAVIFVTQLWYLIQSQIGRPLCNDRFLKCRKKRFFSLMFVSQRLPLQDQFWVPFFLYKRQLFWNQPGCS